MKAHRPLRLHRGPGFARVQSCYHCESLPPTGQCCDQLLPVVTSCDQHGRRSGRWDDGVGLGGEAGPRPGLTVTTPCPERRKISFTQKSVQKLKLMLLFKDPSSRGKIPNNLGSGKGTQNLLLILGICEYVYQVRWQVVREVLLRSGRDIM